MKYLLLIPLALLVWIWHSNTVLNAALDAKNKESAQWQASYNNDEKTIKQLSTYNAANDKIVARFVSAMTGIDTQFGALNLSISNLRRSNADVEKYLSQPIPPALLCVLNRVCNVQSGGTAPATTSAGSGK